MCPPKCLFHTNVIECTSTHPNHHNLINKFCYVSFWHQIIYTRKKKRASGECENNEGRTTYLFCHFTTPWLALTYVALNPILGFLSLLFFSLVIYNSCFLHRYIKKAHYKQVHYCASISFVLFVFYYFTSIIWIILNAIITYVPSRVH